MRKRCEEGEEKWTYIQTSQTRNAKPALGLTRARSAVETKNARPSQSEDLGLRTAEHSSRQKPHHTDRWKGMLVPGSNRPRGLLAVILNADPRKTVKNHDRAKMRELKARRQ